MELLDTSVTPLPFALLVEIRLRGGRQNIEKGEQGATSDNRCTSAHLRPQPRTRQCHCTISHVSAISTTLRHYPSPAFAVNSASAGGFVPGGLSYGDAELLVSVSRLISTNRSLPFQRVGPLFLASTWPVCLDPGPGRREEYTSETKHPIARHPSYLSTSVALLPAG